MHKKHIRNFQEVEIRAILEKKQPLLIKKTLGKLGFIHKGNELITDYYYCPIAVSSFKQIEMNDVGSYSLRLRESQNEHNSILSLNTKVITKAKDHSAWDEHEIKIDSLPKARLILQAMGYKCFFNFSKKRERYQKNNQEVNLEYIKKFGTNIEVEIMAEKKDVADAKIIIQILLSELGVKKEQIVSKSITNMLMKKWAQFS